MTKSQQAVLAGMKLADEAAGQVAARRMADIHRAAKHYSKHLTTLNTSRALRSLADAGIIRRVEISGMGGGFYLYIREENS